MAYVNELAGSKLRAKMGATLNEKVSAPTSSFAQQQLKKMGWSEGEGLGKKRQGMASHIKVRKRSEEVGLGHNDHANIGNQWWADAMGDTLSRLSGKKQKRKTTDDDLFEATGGARFGMRAQRKAVGKWARTESLTETDENVAKQKMEWDGTGQARVVLTETRKPKKKRKKKKKREKDGNLTDNGKKKRKRTNDATEAKKEHSLQSDDGEEKAPKKKSKKEKKKKKKK